MSTRSPRAARHTVGAVATLAALATLALPASPAGADTTVGRFHTLPAGTSLGLDVRGVAVLSRTASSTVGRVVLRGLQPGVTYAAHLHNAPCWATNPGGGHYAHVPGGGITPPNELWFSSGADPTAGVTADGGGVAFGRGRAHWVARPEAQAVVIHAIPPGGTTAGGPKIACANL